MVLPPAPAPAHAASPPASPLRWDIFCRVVDNYGDIGVCWRLAADLAGRGHSVRLWTDDARAVAWMAPGGCPGVELQAWDPAGEPDPLPPPGDVVVEAFGCDPPAGFVARMAAAARPPVWINLEYLSAEAYVERSHRLASPQLSGPGRGLTKWFFYPGFSAATGGLLREPGQVEALAALDPAQVWAELGLAPQPGERCVSVFSYASAPLAQLPSRLADQPTLLLALPGPATALLSAQTLPPGVRLQALPWLSQAGYDRLLRACALNFVRGEDSFVRAQWAGQPFVWQIYEQHDGVHGDKLAAFLARHLHGAEPALAASVGDWMRAWSGLSAPLPPALPPGADWARETRRWRDELLGRRDLLTELILFVTEKR